MAMEPTPTSSDANRPAELLRMFLANRDAPCPACGYNLRDLGGTRCPECGDELVLRVGVVEPRQATLIAGLVGVSAGFGLNALLLLYAAITIFWEGGAGGLVYPFVLTNAVGAVVTGIAIWAWVRNWHRIRRCRAITRRLLMIACWALSLLDLVLFTTMIN
jgi:hypothetical protein